MGTSFLPAWTLTSHARSLSIWVLLTFLDSKQPALATATTLPHSYPLTTLGYNFLGEEGKKKEYEEEEDGEEKKKKKKVLH